MRLRILVKLFFAICAVLYLEVVYLQVFKGEYYYCRKQRNQLKFLHLPAKRGRILTHDGKIISENIPNIKLVFIPAGMSFSQIAATVNNLTKFIHIDKKAFFKRIEELKYMPFYPIDLEVEVTDEILAKIAENKEKLPGVHIEKIYRRDYPSSEVFSPIVGYIGKLSTKEYKDYYPNYYLDDEIGKAGVELSFEGVLRGEAGYNQFEVDPLGKIECLLSSKIPQQGADVYLTIDSRIQQIAYDALGEKKGGVVVLDVDSGRVLALVSKPSLDSNLFVHPKYKRELVQQLKRKDAPLLNRVTSCAFPPGSLFKVIVGAAALEEGVIRPTDIIHCRGCLWVGGKRFKCYRSRAHGDVDIKKALAVSCNVFFYHLGLRLGAERLAEYAKYFGLIQPTGIDLDREKSGFILTPKQKEKEWGQKWYKGETVNLAIGQGYLLATPLQMARVFAMIANGGYMIRPHLLKEIHFPDGKKIYFNSDNLQKIRISANTLDIIKEGLAEAVIYGTARYLSTAKVAIAGKTGSAQIFGERSHSWFVGFAPINRPKLAIAVFIEEGGQGAHTAVPVVHTILNSIVDLKLLDEVSPHR